MKKIFILFLLFSAFSQTAFTQSEDPNLLNSAGGSTSFAPLAGDPANASCCSALQTSSEATQLNSANNCRTPNCGRPSTTLETPSPTPAVAPTAN